MPFVAILIVIGVATSGCGLPVAPSTPVPALTPSEVLTNPKSFLDKRIEVSGRIHVEKYEDLQPCGPDSPGGCTGPSRTTLHIVTEGEGRRESNSLDLYRTKPDGGEEPAVCRVISAAEFDCGLLKANAIAPVTGRLIKHRIPTQQVGYPDGRMVVLQYREIYVLLIQP
jgi:hypothetical protein